MSIISDQVPEGLLVQMVSWSDMERRIARLESAIHQYMQTTDQRGTKNRLIENFVGMYEYTTKQERDKEDASKG